MYCRKCGKHIQGNAQFCPHCGLVVDKNSVSARNKKSDDERETVVLICILLVLVISIVVIAFSYFVLGNSDPKKEEKEIDDAMETVLPTETLFNTETGLLTEALETEPVTSTETEKQTEEQTETEDDGIHDYTIVFPANISWREAREACKSFGGKLLTIDTEEEYRYIKKKIKEELGTDDYMIFYLGGKRPDNGKNLEYKWLDKDGKRYGKYLNSEKYWMKGEPSYSDGDTEEYYMSLFYDDRSDKWTWNDIPNNPLKIAPNQKDNIGYIVEYED